MHTFLYSVKNWTKSQASFLAFYSSPSPSLSSGSFTAPLAKCQGNVTLIILHETLCPILFSAPPFSPSFSLERALSTSVSNQILLHGPTAQWDYVRPPSYHCRLPPGHISKLDFTLSAFTSPALPFYLVASKSVLINKVYKTEGGNLVYVQDLVLKPHGQSCDASVKAWILRQ